jgi:2-haloalkanoic acid dehalogenase type II
MLDRDRVTAITFDCFGTLLEYGDRQFAAAYGEICRSQGIAVDGDTFFTKWMEVWRRLAREGVSTDGGSVGTLVNSPQPLAEPVEVPEHPEHHERGRLHRALEGDHHFRPYSEEWPEHFAICFEELGVKADAMAAYNQLIDLIGTAQAFSDSRRAVETIGRRLPVSLMSNADDNFLYPPLARNGLTFAVALSSEGARAYKPHLAIFERLSEAIGVPRDEILYVGDSPFADVTGAKNAGLQAAWLNRRGHHPLEQAARAGNPETSGTGTPLIAADVEIASLDELVDLFAPR